MNLVTLRTLTRRMVNEVIAHNWDDPDVDAAINIAYQKSQVEILKLYPEAFLEWVRCDTVKDESFYARPAGDWWPTQLRWKGDGGKYTRLRYKPFDEAEDWEGSDHVWTRRGDYIGIFPAPTSAVVDGIEMIHTPSVSLQSDTDTPIVPTLLHYPIALIAKTVLLGETYQDISKDKESIKDWMGDLPMFFQIHGEEPEVFSPRIRKG